MDRTFGVALLVMLAATAACGRSDLFEGADFERSATVVRGYAPPAPAVLTSQAVTPRRLIRTVDLDLAATDITATAARIVDVIASRGGYVGANDAQYRGDVQSLSMILHVPAEDLDVVVAQIIELAAEVHRRRLRTEDVTDRMIDVDARLTTLRATEAELRALLQASERRSGGLEDIMAVYHELTGIRSQIEQFERQLESLATRVELATVNLSLRPIPHARVVAPWNPVGVAQQSGALLLDGLQVLATLVIYLLIAVVPLSLLVAVPVWGAHRLWQRSGRA